MKTVLNICFYCKNVIKGKPEVCHNCGSATRIIKVEAEKTRISPWWKFWNKQFKYEVLNPKYKYLEKRLNPGSTNA